MCKCMAGALARAHNRALLRCATSGGASPAIPRAFMWFVRALHVRSGRSSHVGSKCPAPYAVDSHRLSQTLTDSLGGLYGGVPWPSLRPCEPRGPIGGLRGAISFPPGSPPSIVVGMRTTNFPYLRSCKMWYKIGYKKVSRTSAAAALTSGGEHGRI